MQVEMLLRRDAQLIHPALQYQGLTRRAGKKPPLRAMEELARDREVGHLVFGLPLSPGGDETDWSREVRFVGNALAERLGVPVDFVDAFYPIVRDVLPRMWRKGRWLAERATRGFLDR